MERCLDRAAPAGDAGWQGGTPGRPRRGRAAAGAAALLALLVLCPPPARPDTGVCPSLPVKVTDTSPAIRTRICAAAAEAAELFAACGLPPLGRTVEIATVPEAPRGCVGLYHRGEDRIELLEPEAIAAIRDPGGVFGVIGEESYFASVVVHELAHALFDQFPCPRKSCLVASEYLAYGLQLLSLPPEAQASFAARSELPEPVFRDDFDTLSLVLAPDRFAQQVWTHLQQKQDRCGFLRAVFAGEVVLGREGR